MAAAAQQAGHPHLIVCFLSAPFSAARGRCRAQAAIDSKSKSRMKRTDRSIDIHGSSSSGGGVLARSINRSAESHPERSLQFHPRDILAARMHRPIKVAKLLFNTKDTRDTIGRRLWHFARQGNEREGRRPFLRVGARGIDISSVFRLRVAKLTTNSREIWKTELL